MQQAPQQAADPPELTIDWIDSLRAFNPLTQLLLKWYIKGLNAEGEDAEAEEQLTKITNNVLETETWFRDGSQMFFEEKEYKLCFDDEMDDDQLREEVRRLNRVLWAGVADEERRGRSRSPVPEPQGLRDLV